jgi:hypothetical protein
VNIKFVQSSIKNCITWSKHLRKRRVKWKKACLATNLWPWKLNT